MQAIEKILWPTDSSDYAIRALKTAVVIATKFYAELHAFQVIENITYLDHVGFATVPLAFDYHFSSQHMVEAAQENLQAVLKKRVPGSIRAEVHVELGSPRETIKKFCRNSNIDLIVMATQGLEGFSQLLLGSIVEATVRKYPVPVLVIKPEKLFTPSASRFSPTNLKFL